MLPELIDLDVTMAPIARVKLFGATHDVLPIDGKSQRILLAVLAPLTSDQKLTPSEAAALANENTDRLDAIVAQVVPTLDDDERARMPTDLRMKVIQIAGRQIERVKAAMDQVGAEGKAASPARPRKRRKTA
jgi:hypothetical protein